MFFTLLVCATLNERLIKQKSFLLHSFKIKTVVGTGARQEMCKVIFVLNSATGVCCIISLILELVRALGSMCILGSLKEKYKILQSHYSTHGAAAQSSVLSSFWSVKEVLASQLLHLGVADGECWQQWELLSWQCLSCWIWVKIPVDQCICCLIPGTCWSSLEFVSNPFSKNIYSSVSLKTLNIPLVWGYDGKCSQFWMWISMSLGKCEAF